MLPKQDEKLDPRKKRTRTLIEQAFTDLVNEKGFQALSVQDITEKAGINRATFYAHFPDKFALLEFSVRREFKNAIHKRALNICQFSPENLRQLIITVCEFLDEIQGNCAIAEQQFRLSIAGQVRSQVDELLRHWLESDEFAGNLKYSLERAATAASWSIYGLATEWIRAKHMPPVEEYADEVLPLVSATLGLSSEPA